MKQSAKTANAPLRGIGRPALYGALVLLAVGCGGGEKYQAFNPNSAFFGADETTENAASFSNPELLDPRVSYTDEVIEIDDPTAVGTLSLGDIVGSANKAVAGLSPERAAVIQAVEEIELTLVAEIASPVVNGETLQATSIALDGGDKGLVSYNQQGALRMGAIDYITDFSSDEPRLRSQVLFDDTDISHVATKGNTVYAAAATDSPDVPYPAALDKLELKNDRFRLNTQQREPLISFAATSVIRVNNLVYATSGSAGEVYGFEQNNLALEGSLALDDARWVAWDKDGKRIVVAQGLPGRLAIFEEEEFPGGAMELINSFSFPGADVPEAKTTLDVAGEQAYVAAGTAGVQILCLETGEIVGSVPRPDPAALGLDPSVVVTNAVAVDKDLMFISNGEAGVYVATAEEDFKDYACGESPKITMLGQLQFGDLESVNHIEFENDYLFVAAGVGGVKIVEVEED